MSYKKYLNLNGSHQNTFKRKTHITVFQLLKLSVLVLIASSFFIGCATSPPSPTQQYAMDISASYSQNRFKRVGEITEHSIDMRESSYIFLDDRLASFKGKLSEELRSTYFQTFLISYLHYQKSQHLARTWDPNNPMRKSLEDTYGDSFDHSLFDTPKAAFYYWTDFKIATRSWGPNQSWIYLGSQVFGKSSLSEVTIEDMTEFLEKVAKNPKWHVELKYLGTAKVNWPPSWGNISYFDLIGMSPAEESQPTKNTK